MPPSPTADRTDDPPLRGDAARVREAFAAPDVAGHRLRGRFTERKLAREARTLGRLIDRLGAGRRLDVGCGTGPLGRVIAGGERLYGLDGNPEMAAAAAATAEYAAAVAGDATRLPFGDRAFASAVSIRLLHHLDASSRRRVLGELRRVVDGPVIVSFFDSGTLEALRATRRRASRGSRRAISLGCLRADAAATGWRVEAVARKWWRITEHVYVLLDRVADPADHACGRP